MASRPDYQFYQAKDLSENGIAPWIRSLRRFLQYRVVYDGLLLPFAITRHRRLLRRSERTSEHTYTCFLRSPSQLDLVTGPIMDYVGRPDPLSITLLACSNGAEAYTLASELRFKFPGLRFKIRASDLHDTMVARAAEASYSRDEALHSPYMTSEFVERTFLEENGGFRVRDEIRKHVEFSTANLLEGDALRAKFGQSPIVVAQNVLFHLTPENAERAFENLLTLMTPDGVLLIEGMDLDLRERLTAKHGLEPFTENLQHIYEETRIHTPPHWWKVYWGTEPYLPFRRNAKRRYSTAFRRSSLPD